MGKTEKVLTKEQIKRRLGILGFVMNTLGVSGSDPKKMNIVGKEMFLPTEVGKVRVLAYNMDNPEKLPLFVNMHGSGFTMGNAEMDDPLMMNVAENAKVKILNVDYSLSPGVMFPVALNECYSVIKYAKEHGDELGIDGARVAVGGHSAGGNFSASICLLDAERKQLGIKCLILDYPPLDIYTDPYLKRQPKGSLPPRMARLFNAAYCAKEEAKNPLISPAFATVDQVKSFPPTLIITAANDSLCEEAEKFGETLKKSGVDVTHKRFDIGHGFTYKGAEEPKSKEAWQMMIDHLKLHLHE